MTSTGRAVETETFYLRVLMLLAAADVPFAVAGAFAFRFHTGIVRHTKDLDLLLRPADRDAVLARCRADGLRTEIPYDHWLAKVYDGTDYVDLIYGTVNGAAKVDDACFARATAGRLFGVPVRYCSPEEMIWGKAFAMERDRYDGADVAHLLRCCQARIDWRRLLDCFGPHWRVLLAHLVLFGFIYPSERAAVPAGVMGELLARLDAEAPSPERLCRGTLLAGSEYLIDVEQWGYADARLRPWGEMTAEDVARWKQAIRQGT